MAPPPSTEIRLRDAIVRVCRAMHDRGYVSGWAGNVSARVDERRVLLTPAGVPKRDLTAGDLIVVERGGAVLETRDGRRPTSELPMHLCVYRRRADVGAVVHAHPVNTVALGIAGDGLSRAWVPEAITVLGPVAVTPYATPSSAENERVVADVIDRHDAVVLRWHGSVTVGRTLDEAYLRLETLEHAAAIAVALRSMGGGPEIPPDEVAKLVAMRERARRRTVAACGPAVS